MVDLEERVKLRVLGDRLEQLTGVIVPTCLNQLEQHGRNIQQYQEDEEWESLKREQRNVSKTIRVCLRKHIRRVEAGIMRQVVLWDTACNFNGFISN